MPSANELAIARYQGKHVAEIAKALKSRQRKKYLISQTMAGTCVIPLLIYTLNIAE
jgi:hypothetical protein